MTLLIICNCLKSVVLEMTSQRLRQDLEVDTVGIFCSCCCSSVVVVVAWAVVVVGVGVFVEITDLLSTTNDVLSIAYNKSFALSQL